MSSIGDSVAQAMQKLMTDRKFTNKFASFDGEAVVEDTQAADDQDVNLADDKTEQEEKDEAKEDKTASDLTVAIDGLLTASAALDAVGFEKIAEATLRLAGFVVEAKKKAKMTKEQKAEFAAKMKKSREKEQADKQAAKDKMLAQKKKEKEAEDKMKMKAKMEAEKAKAKAKADKEKAAKKDKK